MITVIVYLLLGGPWCNNFIDIANLEYFEHSGYFDIILPYSTIVWH